MQVDSNDLLSIQPDSWCNIPLPLKQALTLLTQHLSGQSLQLSQLLTQQEGLQERLHREEQRCTELTAGLGKWQESLRTLERDIEEKQTKDREEMRGKLEMERKERIIEAKKADRCSTEASTRLTSLINHYSTAISDLKSAQTSLKAAVPSEVQSLLAPHLKSIREASEEQSQIGQKSLKTLTARVEEIEEYRRNGLVSRLEIVQKTAEMALAAANELKIKEKEQQLLTETQNQAVLTPLIDSIAQLEASLQGIRRENRAEIATIAVNLDSLHSNITRNHEELLKETDIRIKLASKSLSAASKSAYTALSESQKSLETALKVEFEGKMEALNRNWADRMQQYVAQELKEIREKLSVRPM